MYRCRRARRAAATLVAMSVASASRLSFRWPHFFGNSWSSICTAAAPASSKERTIAITFSASPYPVSPSTSSGSPDARVIWRTKKHTSSTVIMPRSGSPMLAVIAAPDR